MKKILFAHKKLLAINLLFIICASFLFTTIAFLLQAIIDAAAELAWGRLQGIAIIAVLFLSAYFVFHYFKSYYSKVFFNCYIKELREKLFDVIINRKPENFQTITTSEYLSVVTNDIQLFGEGMLNSSILIAQNMVSAIVAFLALIYISPSIALVVMICLVFMYIVPYCFGKIIQRKQLLLSDALVELMTAGKSFLSGFQVIHSYRLQKHCVNAFEEKNLQAQKARMNVDFHSSLSENLSAVLSVATEIIVLFASAWLVMRQKISIGTMVAIMQLNGAFIQPLMMIMQNVPKVIGGISMVKRFEEVITYEDSSFVGKVNPMFEDGIEFCNMSFSYDGVTDVLNHVNCNIEKGKTYAVVGPSGSGKTTLVRLLTGLSSKYSGEIKFDGKELRSLALSEVLSFMAVIQQDSFLFDTDIKSNITLGGYEKDLMEAVCADSGVNLFLPQLPAGLNTRICDNGANLSGGQKQRIAIARALYQKKPILILDESTAAIDQKTAADIQERLLNIEGLTLITITHDLDPAVLSQYDQIIYVSESHTVMQETYRNLYEIHACFRAFVNSDSKATGGQPKLSA